MGDCRSLDQNFIEGYVLTSRDDETIGYINDRVKRRIILDIFFDLSAQITPQSRNSFSQIS